MVRNPRVGRRGILRAILGWGIPDLRNQAFARPTRDTEAQCRLVATIAGVLLLLLGLPPAEAQAARTVNGTFAGAGSFHGFSVAMTPAGSGGVLISGMLQVTQFSQAVNGIGTDFMLELQPGQYIMTSATGGGRAFYQVVSISSPTSMQITPASPFGAAVGQGYNEASDTVSAEKNMTVLPMYQVTFTRAFQSAPTIVISARGHQPAPNSGQTAALDVVQLLQEGAMTGSGFKVVLYQYPFGPYIAPSTTIDFIAIGN